MSAQVTPGRRGFPSWRDLASLATQFGAREVGTGEGGMSITVDEGEVT